MSEESFATAPMSLAEYRAERAADCTKWSPRDALISTLRAIDSGEIKPDTLVITYHCKGDDGVFCVSTVIASPGKIQTIGVLSYALNDLM